MSRWGKHGIPCRQPTGQQTEKDSDAEPYEAIRPGEGKGFHGGGEIKCVYGVRKHADRSESEQVSDSDPRQGTQHANHGGFQNADKEDDPPIDAKGTQSRDFRSLAHHRGIQGLENQISPDENCDQGKYRQVEPESRRHGRPVGRPVFRWTQPHSGRQAPGKPFTDLLKITSVFPHVRSSQYDLHAVDFPRTTQESLYRGQVAEYQVVSQVRIIVLQYLANRYFHDSSARQYGNGISFPDPEFGRRSPTDPNVLGTTQPFVPGRFFLRKLDWILENRR